MEEASCERALEADAAAAVLVVEAFVVVVLEKGACEVELEDAFEVCAAAVPEEVIEAEVVAEAEEEWFAEADEDAADD